MKLKDKVAIITGSSRGVGKYIAIELAKEGCNIVVAARSEEESNASLPGTIYETAEELRSLGVRALPVRTDVTDETSIRAMVQASMDEFGRIDVLVNNAGIVATGRLWEIPVKRWDIVNRVNVRGEVICCQAVIPHMIERGEGGVIVNISSIAADQKGLINASYAVTKLTLRKLAESLAEEAREFDIRVFSLSPEGLVITPGTQLHRIDEQVPSGPFVEAPEAMGQAVIYLASDAAKPLSGRHYYSRALLRDAGIWSEPAPDFARRLPNAGIAP